MRFSTICSFILALLLTSCANEGVVVRKNSGPLPFYESLGVDGSYKLALRDNAGAVHTQLVTPEVFQGYAEGDYFNDLQPPPTQGASSTATNGAARIAPAGTGAGQNLAGGKSPNGRQFTTNVIGRARTPALAKSPESSNAQAFALAQRPHAASLMAKAPDPTVSAHFAVAVQQPTSPMPAGTTVAFNTKETSSPTPAASETLAKSDVAMTPPLPLPEGVRTSAKSSTSRVITSRGVAKASATSKHLIAKKSVKHTSHKTPKKRPANSSPSARTTTKT